MAATHGAWLILVGRKASSCTNTVPNSSLHMCCKFLGLVPSVISLAFAGVTQHLVSLQQRLELLRCLYLLRGITDMVRVQSLCLTPEGSLRAVERAKQSTF